MEAKMKVGFQDSWGDITIRFRVELENSKKTNSKWAKAMCPKV
jgi:hypothetical protein